MKMDYEHNRIGQPIDGIMFEFDHLRSLSMEEYKFYLFNPLPFGWSIIQEPIEQETQD